MYNKVVVPLDGSKLAELALPHLEEIAKGCSIPDILLVSVTEKIKGRIQGGQIHETFVPERPVGEALPQVSQAQSVMVYNTHTYGVQEIPISMGKMARTASEYLCKTAECLKDKGFSVMAAVLIGNPAEQIVTYVNEQNADLIIMASAGKAQGSRWDMSKIAERVIKETSTPVLLVKPSTDFKETKPRRKGVAL
jgi:nucleotide-binding universal stress UspA family protein